MCVRYMFRSGCILESIPGRTTGEEFAANVAEILAAGDEIIDIQFGPSLLDNVRD